MSLLKRDLRDCRTDNERLTTTVNDVTLRHTELQDAFSRAQAQLGRKDTQLSGVQEEK